MSNLNLSSRAKRKHKKLAQGIDSVYTDSQSGMVPTDTNTIKNILEPIRTLISNEHATTLFVRPLTGKWVAALPRSCAKYWSFWDKPMINRGTKRMIANMTGTDKNNIDLRKRQDFVDIIGAFSKDEESDSAFKNSLDHKHNQKYVLDAVGQYFKNIFGNVPFGSLTGTKGDYIAWKILKFCFYLLEPLTGVMVLIIPNTLFLPNRSSGLESLRTLILPYLEFLDLDTNSYFIDAGNAPGITMVAITVNKAKQDDIVKVRRGGQTYEVKHADLDEFLSPGVDKVRLQVCRISQVTTKNIFMTPDVTGSTAFTGTIPASQGAMIKGGYASKNVADPINGLINPIRYSTTILYVSDATVNNHYTQTNNKLKVVLNFIGHFWKPGKDDHYMPIDRLPLGKCAEGIAVKSVKEGKILRHNYTRKLPVWFVMRPHKGRSKFLKEIFELPFKEEFKTRRLTDSDWYELAGLTQAQIDLVEKEYDEFVKNQWT